MIKLKFKSVVFAALFLFGLSFSVFAQGGGKAEPLRISFKTGDDSATVTGKLKTDEQYEFVFGAKSNQKIALKIRSLPPGKFTTFEISGADNNFAAEADKNGSLTFAAPETGDYLIFVKLLPNAGKTKQAKFALTLTIK